MLSFKESLQLLEKYGIPLPKYSVYPDKIDKFPVVLKVSSEKIIHKTDVGGVILNVLKEEFEDRIRELKSKFPDADIIIQEQLDKEKYLELIVGIKEDDIFDYFILVGLGGIYTEIFKDFIILVPEFTKEDFMKRIKDLRSYSILEGYRGKTRANLNLLYEVIKKLEIIFIKENLKELEINPLFINNREAWIIDVRINK